MRLNHLLAAGALFAVATVSFAQEAPTGSQVSPTGAEQKLVDQLKGTVKGKIVWASSRSNSKHDLWIMNADGTDQKQLTKGDYVDFFSRFSPDRQKVIFTRSKFGWVSEMDAEQFDKWDVWTVNVDGTNETKVAENCSWGTWRPTGDSIVFARGSKVFIKCLADGNETEVLDIEKTIKKGAYSQEPQMTADGQFVGITVRGAVRQTGIYNRATSKFESTGGGCEITPFPNSREWVRVNEGHGNGGTEVLRFKIDDNGKPLSKMTGAAIPKEVKLMDIPGRRSHEYYPKISDDAQWMVWGSTQYGHEHDIVDYEIYIWKIGTPAKNATRITFHDGNDRWPDLYLDK